MDENGNIRISLLQYKYNGTESEQVKITMVYFRKIDPAEHLILAAPTPDIPVSKMSWILFYSNKHNIARVKGDFAVSSGTFFKRMNQIRKEHSDVLYQSIAESGRARKVPMLPDASPKHIYARKLLVVDEQPVLELEFDSRNNSAIIVIVSLSIIVSAALLFHIYRRQK